MKFVLSFPLNSNSLHDVVWLQIMLLSEMVSNCRSFVFLNSLVQVLARITDVTCIARVTFIALCIAQGRLVFPYFDFFLDLSTCLQRTNTFIDLSTEVTELSAYCVCRFLIFKGQHFSDWSFSLVASQIFAP